jgi:hypothetical protein
MRHGERKSGNDSLTPVSFVGTPLQQDGSAYLPLILPLRLSTPRHSAGRGKSAKFD